MIKQSKLLENLESSNLAELLDEKDLKRLGHEVTEKYELDDQSRESWKRQYEVALKLAAQIVENKSIPWRGASNVKYPLITMACVQFHARASQSLLNETEPVKAKAIGFDETGAKQERATRVAKYMSYKVTKQMNGWLDQTDRLLMVLPLTGTCYKKSYISPKTLEPVSPLVLPQSLVINYGATDFETCRKTHILKLTKNEFLSYQRKGVFLDSVDILKISDAATELFEEKLEQLEHKIQEVQPDQDDSVVLLEQHYEWDLDGDGYKEPYIVTCAEATSEVVRIVPRYTDQDIEWNDSGKISEIKAENYFTRYIFLPSLTSSVYGIGFGTLLGAINDSVNSLINQLIDTGTLATRQAGFIGKGVRLGNKSIRAIAPGMWVQAQSTGDDIRKAIFPLPVKEPSTVLFQLLSLLIQIGEETSSVADLMRGESPGQNQPWATTQAMLEQGMQVFSGIYKRAFRALAREYNVLYRLFSETVDDADYQNILGSMVQTEEDKQKVRQIPPVQEEFRLDDMDIMPASDPDVTSKTQQYMKIEGLFQAAERGIPVNPTEVAKRLVEAQGHENPEALYTMPEPQPSPEQQFEMAKFEDESARGWAELILQAMTLESEQVKDAAQAVAHLARAKSMEQAPDLERMKIFTEYLTSREGDESDNNRAVLDALTKLKVAKEKPANGSS